MLSWTRRGLLCYSLLSSSPLPQGNDDSHALFFVLYSCSLRLLPTSSPYQFYHWYCARSYYLRHALTSSQLSYPCVNINDNICVVLICYLSNIDLSIISDITNINISKYSAIFLWLHSLQVLDPSLHLFFLHFLKLHPLCGSDSHPCYCFIDLYLSCQ